MQIMNNNFKKFHEEVERQMNLCEEKKYLANGRMRTAHISQFGYKSLLGASLGMVFYLIVYFTLLPSAIIASSWLFPTVLFAISMGVGILEQKLIYKIAQIEEKFRTFSSAKKDSKKYEEEIKYAIELEQTKRRLDALQSIAKKMEDQEDIIDSLSIPFEGKKEQIFKESLQKSEYLSTGLKKGFEDLDDISKKLVLIEKMRSIRSREELFMNSSMTLLCSVVSSMLISFPFIFIGNPAPMVAFGVLLSSLVGTTALFGGWMTKRTIDNKTIFDKINSPLGSSRLPRFTKNSYEEIQMLECDIAETMEQIAGDALNLEKEQCIQRIVKSEIDEGDHSIKYTNSLDTLEHREETILEDEKKEEKGRSLTIAKKDLKKRRG